MAHGTRTDATRHARPRGRAAHGPRGEPRWPELTRTRGKGHASPRGCPRGHHMASEEAGIWRTHGLVGPGEYIGAVTQGHYSAPHYILITFHFLFHVGLCSHGISPLQVTWQHGGCRMRSRHVHRVDVESTGLLIKTRALKMHLSKVIDGIESDTWLHQRSGATINNSPSSTMQRRINDGTWLHQRCNDHVIYLDATMKIGRTRLIAK